MNRINWYNHYSARLNNDILVRFVGILRRQLKSLRTSLRQHQHWSVQPTDLWKPFLISVRNIRIYVYFTLVP